MPEQKTVIAEAAEVLTQPFTHTVVGQVDDYCAYLSRFDGAHKFHEHAKDEMYLVLEGEIFIDYYDGPSVPVRQGEVLGVVGVAGNGQKPLVETICGLRRPASGTIKILGKNWDQFYARHSWDGNLIYIPEDRRGLATCLDLDLVEEARRDMPFLRDRRPDTYGPLLKS